MPTWDWRPEIPESRTIFVTAELGFGERSDNKVVYEAIEGRPILTFYFVECF